MNAVPFVAGIALASALLSPPVLLAQTPIAGPPPAPVPAELQSAKKIFVSNAGSDSGLFPHPFSGDTNRGYNELFSARAWPI